MPLETAAGIWDLEPTNPPASDQLAQTDDHLRLIKAAILATFPNINAAVTISDEVLNELTDRALQFADGTSGAPSVQVGSAGVQGLYKYGTNKLGIAGRLVGDGAVPVGSVHMFPKVPSGLKTDGTSGGTFIELNGATYNYSDYPDLGAFYGVSSGTFTVDDMYTDGRFPRSRTASVTVGDTQANQNKAHTHSVTGTAASDGDHDHTASSAVTDNGHEHFIASTHTGANVTLTNTLTLEQAAWAGGDGATVLSGHSTPATIGKSSTETTGIAVATTVNSGGDHTHSVSGTAASDGGTEARPNSIAFIFAVKT